MKSKKLFSLLVSVLVLISSLGIFTVSAATITKTVNVAVSPTAYTLPTGEMTADDGTTTINVASWSAATADVSKIGYRLFTGTDSNSGSEVTLRVNAGRYDLRLSDDMENHGSTQVTVSGTAVETIDPVNSDGFKLAMTNKTKGEVSAVIAEEDDNQYISIKNKTFSTNATWTVVDAFNGDFRVSAKLKLDNIVTGDTTYGISGYLRLWDTAGTQITNATGMAVYTEDGTTFSRLEGASVKDGGNNGANTYNSVTDAKYNLTTGKNADSSLYVDWFTMAIDVHGATKTYDILINDVPVHTNLPFAKDAATGNIGKITLCFRSGAPYSMYVDDLTVYQYNCFTGDLQTEADQGTVLLGWGGSNVTTIPLTLSNGNIWNANMTINANTANIGMLTDTSATVEGFSEAVTVDAKVCNYHIESIAYKKGSDSDFVSAPVAGGTVASADVVKKGTKTGKALFVWYNQSGEMKALKQVDMPSKSGKIEVNMALPTTEADVTNGMLKVFIVNDLTNLQPIDIVTDEAWKAASAPTVYVMGDSMSCDYPTNITNSQFPKTGIGQVLDEYLDVTVVNKAVSGATTQSAISSLMWDTVYQSLKSGDYVFISFGHNDQVKCTGDIANCFYGTNIEMFIQKTLEKGANPIFFTPVARRLEGRNTGKASDGVHSYAYSRFNGEYSSDNHPHMDQLLALCEKYDVPVINMSDLSSTYLQGLASDDAAKPLYTVDQATVAAYENADEWANSRYNPSSTATKSYDNTHLTLYGAHVFTDILVDAIAENYPNIALTPYIDVTAEPGVEADYLK